MRYWKNLAFTAFLTAAAGSVQAATITIDFTGDAPGSVSNGFVSSGSSIVSFTDSDGSDLVVDDFVNQSFGNALGVYGDDPSKLIMDFSQTVRNLSFFFGNDDPDYSLTGDVAVVQGFLNGVLQGAQVVTLNRDDLMNQSISLSNLDLDQAVFFYGRFGVTSEGGFTINPINLIEIVDNITFDIPDVAPVPLPASGLLLLGAVGALLATRRRRAA